MMRNLSNGKYLYVLYNKTASDCIIKSCLIFLIIAKKYQSFVSHNYTIIGLEGDVWERRKQCFRLQHYIDKK